jgi:hypothetical protein
MKLAEFSWGPSTREESKPKVRRDAMIGFASRREHRRPEGRRTFPSGRFRFRLAERCI